VCKQYKDSPCVTIFISNCKKYHVSLIIFYVFSSTKLENRKVEQVLGGRAALVPMGGRRWQEKE
jgi:hypothetical protein